MDKIFSQGLSKSQSKNEKQAQNNAKQYLHQTALDHGRIPPQATDIEEAVLGALMLEKNALTQVIDILKAKAFYKESHQWIYTAISNLFAKSEPVDLLTVTNELKSEGKLEAAGGAYYLSQLTNKVASAANVEFHAKIIIEKYILRSLITISSETIHDAYDDTSDVFDLLDKAEAKMFSISEENFRRSHDTMESLVKQSMDEIEQAKNHDGKLRGVPSGFTEVDRMTNGWQKSDLVVLAARPGMGKTAYTLSMARNIAVDHNIPVAIFSLEMSSVQLVTRLISSESKISADTLKKGTLKDYEWEQLNAKINNLISAPIYIDDTPSLSVFELRAKCRRLKEQHDIQIILIDYIQLMTAGMDNKSGNREQEISLISRSLKALAKELNVPVIALSQLSRAVETRGGLKKPMLSDLRESGAIEQDADMVIFIYRPEYYQIDNDEKGDTAGKADIIIAKHRNGALGEIRVDFIAKYARFQDPEDFSTMGLPAMDSENNEMSPNSDFDSGQPSTYTVPSKMNNDDETPF